MGSWPADPRPRAGAAPPVRGAEHGFARPDMDSSEGRGREPKPAWSAECAVRFRSPSRADGRRESRAEETDRSAPEEEKGKKGKGHAGGKEGSFLHSRAGYRPAALLLFASHSSHEEDRSLHKSQLTSLAYIGRAQHFLHSLRDYDDDDDPLLPMYATTTPLWSPLAFATTDEEDTAGVARVLQQQTSDAREHHPGSSVHFLNMLQSCR